MTLAGIFEGPCMQGIEKRHQERSLYTDALEVVLNYADPPMALSGSALK